MYKKLKTTTMTNYHNEYYCMITILLAKVMLSNVARSYHRVHERYFPAVFLTLAGPKHFTRISKIMARQTRNVSLWAFVC